MKIFCDIEPSTYQVQTHNLWFRKLNYVLCNYPNFEQMINLIRISTIIFLEHWTMNRIMNPFSATKMALLSKGKVLKRLTLCMLQFTIILKLLGIFFYSNFYFKVQTSSSPPLFFSILPPTRWVGVLYGWA